VWPLAKAIGFILMSVLVSTGIFAWLPSFL
jgi:hypothetical protein